MIRKLGNGSISFNKSISSLMIVSPVSTEIWDWDDNMKIRAEHFNDEDDWKSSRFVQKVWGIKDGN
jgi:hypothetical protein